MFYVLSVIENLNRIAALGRYKILIVYCMHVNIRLDYTGPSHRYIIAKQANLKI